MKRNLAIISSVFFLSLPAVQAADGSILSPPPSSSSALTILPGQSRILKFPAIRRAAIGNPAVADIAVLSDTELLLNAKGAGTTLLYVRNAKGAASVSIVVPGAASAVVDIAAGVNEAIAGTGVTATFTGGAVVLRGTVDTPADEAKVIAVAKAFSPTVASLITVAQDATSTMAHTLTSALEPFGVTARASGSNVIILEGQTTTEKAGAVLKLAAQLAGGYQIVNLVQDNVAGRQVVVHARIVAADQTALRNLGIDWGSILVDSDGVPNGIGQPVLFGETRSGGMGLGEGGPLRRLNRLGAALQALEQGNRAKTLSAPDVLVEDNHTAEIVVGGEIPVPVPQVGAGTNTIIIQYKEYGVKLSVTPRILDDGAVSMHVMPEVSTLDQANAVFLAGFRIPAFKVRKAETNVTVKSGDTLVIGGLLQDEDIDIIRKIPILADIPILGELFKFRSKSRVRTQLVILVTPEILAPGAKPPVPALAALEPDNPVLGPALSDFTKHGEAPSMPGLPSPGRTPIPMSGEKVKASTTPGLGYM